MAVVRLDLRVWVALSRPRLWIFLVRRDVGSQDIVDKAVEIAHDIEEHRRAAAPPDAIKCSALVDSRTRDSLGAPRSDADAVPAKEPAWQTVCKAQRSKWKSLGWPFHDEHPLAAAEFAGMTCTPREREILKNQIAAAVRTFWLEPPRSGRVEVSLSQFLR